MSMDHKAFAFDHRGFSEALRELLLEALRSGDGEPLRALIDLEPSAYQHPDEPGPLDADWQSLLASTDVHALGDVALTKYYDPNEDIGVAGDWMDLDDALLRYGLGALLLGEPLGSREAGGYFDPGKMGSYFQSESDVRNNLRRLDDAERQHPDLVPTTQPVRTMLERAAQAGRGIYATF